MLVLAKRVNFESIVLINRHELCPTGDTSLLVNGKRFSNNGYLPSATKLRQGNIFTSVCHSVNRGVSNLSVCWDTHPLGQTSPPWQTPPGQTPLGRHPPWADTPWADIPPFGQTPPGQTPPTP